MEEISEAQRQHLEQRLAEITDKKVRAKREELYGPAGRPEQPTWGMVFEGIRNGDITLKEDKVDYTGPYLNPSDVVWPAMEAKAAELEAYIEKLEAEAQDVLDRFVFSNINGLVDALKAYEAM